MCGLADVTSDFILPGILIPTIHESRHAHADLVWHEPRFLIPITLHPLPVGYRHLHRVKRPTTSITIHPSIHPPSTRGKVHLEHVISGHRR